MIKNRTSRKNVCRSGRLRLLVVISLGIALFTYGLGVGHYKWPPFAFLYDFRATLFQFLVVPKQEYRGEGEVLQDAFLDPVIETELYYPAIYSLQGLRETNQQMLMRQEGFEGAYNVIDVLSVEQIDWDVNVTSVVKILFSYQGRTYSAFAYGQLPEDCDGRTASLIIPGSGLNQSKAIAEGNLDNYHDGILDALDIGVDVYTYIKPNEDYLAWHNGAGNKLSGEFIWNWHLNRSGSYSVSYLVETLAFTKWLKTCYDQTILAGLSQGGSAVLLNAMQSEPNFAIVSSGHSVLNNLAERSGHDQLIGVPGYGKLSEQNYLVDALRHSSTRWFFSWGLREEGIYKIEAEEQTTANVISHLPNVTVSIHEGGHVFPVEEIQTFLSRVRDDSIQPMD